MLTILSKLDVFFPCRGITENVRNTLVELLKQRLMDLQLFKSNAEFQQFIVQHNLNPKLIQVHEDDPKQKQKLELEINLCIALLSFEQNEISNEKLENMVGCIAKAINTVQTDEEAAKLILCWDFVKNTFLMYKEL